MRPPPSRCADTGVVARMSVHLVRLPVRGRRDHGIGAVSGAIDNVILRLETDTGIVGWGEASPWPAFAGTPEASAAALDRYLRPVVIGADPRRVSALMVLAGRVLVGHLDAKAALEAALLDIVGKAAGLAVCDLLGGRCRDRIPLSFSLADADFAADLDKVAALHAEGVRLFKLKTGFAGHRFDIERLETLCKRYDDIGLRVDYNQGLDPFDAIRILRDIESFRPDFIEQPVPAADHAAMAAIAAALDTPILADEAVFTADQALLAVRDRIADGFSIKIMKSGGARAAQGIAAIAGAAGLAAYGGDMFETGLAHLAGTHMVAATPAISLGCEFYQARHHLETDILAEPFPIEEGCVVVPTAPGLGGIVDETVLARLSIETRG